MVCEMPSSGEDLGLSSGPLPPCGGGLGRGVPGRLAGRRPPTPALPHGGGRGPERRPRPFAAGAVLVLAVLLLGAGATAPAQEGAITPHWVWHPNDPNGV